MENLELTLEEIKTEVFQILKHFKEFCEENDISFFLSNGTLLGAVKYGGFIPWDDDIDVFVPRKDYDRLMKLYPEGGCYTLCSIERKPGYRYSFAKLCNMEIRKEEINTHNGIPLGLDIDIFPLDGCTEHILKPGVQRRLRWYQIGYILSKFKTAKGKPFAKQCVIWYCQMRGYRHFQKGLSRIVQREGRLGCTHKGCLMWPIYGAREILPAEVFASAVTVTFEKMEFPAPVGYDRYLRSLYGDYEQDPPPEKQKTHHGFRAFRA